MEEPDLYETLLARPDDPSIAMVFADWLQERGDPMAEFFALQGSTDTREAQRAQDVLIMNWRRWFGPLARVLRRRKSVFQDGFLKRAELLLEPDSAIAPLGSAPQWASVRELVVVSGRPIVGSLEPPQTPRPPPSLAPLLESRWLGNLVALDCVASSLRDATSSHFRLKQLRLSGDPSLAALQPAWAALDRLEVETEAPLTEALCASAKTIEQRLPLRAAVRLLHAARPVSGELTFVCPGWRFTPRADGVHVELSAMAASEFAVVNGLGQRHLIVTGLRSWQGPASQLRF